MSDVACGVCAVELAPAAPGYLWCAGCETVTRAEAEE